MGAFHNFILSTTPNLDCYKINKYFGTVTSHIVAGTGLFSDFAAEFRDVFGGRSASYQKQLISIKEEVLKRLKEEATILGANGIVGLKVDFDEISGKGKTMFMVSALGTAVQIEFMGNKEEANLQSGELHQVTSDKLNLEIEKQELIDSFKDSNYTLSSNDWVYITENSITEIFDPLFDFVKKISKEWTYSDVSYYQEYKDYLKSLPDEFLIVNIYLLFFAEHIKIKELAYSLIDERELLNLKPLNIILNAKNINAKKYGLKTLFNCDKRFYTKEDITEFEEIKKIIQSNFPELGERVSKKKLMSSNQVENWSCPDCNKENSSEDKYCKKCGSDIRGFFEKDINPEDVIIDIDNKLEVLKKLLNQ